MFWETTFCVGSQNTDFWLLAGIRLECARRANWQCPWIWQRCTLHDVLCQGCIHRAIIWGGAGLIHLNVFWLDISMGMSGRLNGRLTDIDGWVLRWWHSWVSLATLSSWTTVSEPLFHSWNVPKQNSIKRLPQPENWELLQRLKHQGFRSFSPTLREFQIRELVCQSYERKTPKEPT